MCKRFSKPAECASSFQSRNCQIMSFLYDSKDSVVILGKHNSVHIYYHVFKFTQLVCIAKPTMEQ